MTTVNGNLQDGDWRAYMIYETESTRETYTVKVTSAGTYISNVTWINQAWSTTVSATGQSSVSKSIGATYLTKGDRKKLVSATFKWNRGTSSSTKTDAVKASRQPSSMYKSNASISLYAVWKKTLTLSYSSAEGTGATGLPQPQSADIYNSTSSYIFTIPSEAPSRDLYEFLGWSTDEAMPTVS